VPLHTEINKTTKMRTKIALLVAVATAAGIATSVAQVFSVNAVGYVNKTIPAGALVPLANPLNTQNNTVAQLFGNNALEIFIYNTSTSGWDFVQGLQFGNTVIWEPENLANRPLEPGQGVFVRNPGTSPVTITFVGEVPQGQLTTPLVAGLQMVASKVPQSGTAEQLGLVGQANDEIFQWNDAAQSYTFHQFLVAGNLGFWEPDLRPLAVGESFFLRTTAARNWSRDFNVNQ
jgi:hypothetical protein